MRRNSKQVWEVGKKVKVQLLSLEIVAKKVTLRDWKPDAYLLTNGKTFYQFVPHYGLKMLHSNVNIEKWLKPINLYTCKLGRPGRSGISIKYVSDKIETTMATSDHKLIKSDISRIEFFKHLDSKTKQIDDENDAWDKRMILMEKKIIADEEAWDNKNR